MLSLNLCLSEKDKYDLSLNHTETTSWHPLFSREESSEVLIV